MATKKTENEYQRIKFIYEMISLYSHGSYSDAEIGERFGTDRTNIYKIRKLMVEELGIPIEPDPNIRGQYRMDPDFNIRYIPFSPEQMGALYIAGRRLQQQTKTAQSHVAGMLRNVARAFNNSLAEELVDAAQKVLEQEQDYQQEQIFATLLECWLGQIPVRITHRVHHGQARTYRVHPYQLEPAVWGDGIYLVGYSEYHGKIATFKTARIEKVTMGTGQFEIPEDFNIHDLLNHAWGIWHADSEPITVRLKFSRWVTPRVKETIWHPQATLTVHDDGSSTWEVQVAEWKEMVPWVRSWGADVEVVEPEELRTAMTKEVRRLIKLYDVVELPPIPLAQRLWAKTSKDRRQTHPLLCHLIDVAQVALTLWQHGLTKSSREHFAHMLGLDVEDAGRTIAFWIGLHDLGKACPGFQRLHPPAIEELTAAGLAFPNVMVKERCYHAMVTTCTLATLLTAETDIHRRVAKKIGQALGGHHGTWPHPTQTDGVKQSQIGDKQWDDVRRELVCHLRDLLQPVAVTNLGDSDDAVNTFLTLFSGLTTVADWIGSMEEYFPYVDAPIEARTYFAQAGRQAHLALEELNWISWQPPQKTLAFEELFPFPPNAVQKEAIKIAPKLGESALVIVEVTTGAGKTETALYLADHQAANHQQRGMYIAMPTMATSNQMYSRATEFLQKRYRSDAAKPMLIHSQARWISEQSTPELNVTEEGANASVRDMGWFLPRKRSLLTPFAVGTVDQALLSVLQTRHFFVRLFALSHKTIIFDEVHAYDIYMSELFEMLLGWLRMVGATVILLSATLPAKTRQRLVSSYSGKTSEHVDDAPYPSITWASGDQVEVVPLEATEARPPITLQWLDRDPDSICAALKEQLANGGCAAIICNTIARAQEIHRVIEEANLVSADDLILFHARNPFAWRDATEKNVLERFGKDGEKNGLRPPKAIVVATQVIEQSLDLDFDFMISDLAPVDLLLQRAGRLHRHDRDTRPSVLENPSLFIAVDMNNFNHPEFGNDKYIYAEYILIKSYLALKERDALHLPQETSALIEAVYGDEMAHDALSPELQEKLEASFEEMTRQEKSDVSEAINRLIYAPHDENLLYQRTPGLEEDSPELHASFQALTRLGDRSISIVCLHQINNQLNTEPDCNGEIIVLDQKPNHDQTRILAQYTISLSNKSIVHYLLEYGEKPSAWADHALLRDHFVLKFLDGIVNLPEIKTTLRLSRTYGLEILKEDS